MKRKAGQVTPHSLKNIKNNMNLKRKRKFAVWQRLGRGKASGQRGRGEGGANKCEPRRVKREEGGERVELSGIPGGCLTLDQHKMLFYE